MRKLHWLILGLGFVLGLTAARTQAQPAPQNEKVRKAIADHSTQAARDAAQELVDLQKKFEKAQREKADLEAQAAQNADRAVLQQIEARKRLEIELIEKEIAQKIAADQLKAALQQLDRLQKDKAIIEREAVKQIEELRRQIETLKKQEIDRALNDYFSDPLGAQEKRALEKRKPAQATTPGPDSKIDRLIAELAELRNDVKALHKRLDVIVPKMPPPDLKKKVAPIPGVRNIDIEIIGPDDAALKLLSDLLKKYQAENEKSHPKQGPAAEREEQERQLNQLIEQAELLRRAIDKAKAKAK